VPSQERLSKPGDFDQGSGPAFRGGMLGLEGCFPTTFCNRDGRCWKIRLLQKPRESSWGAGIHFAAGLYPSYGKSSQCASNYYPHGKTTKKVGTTSTFSDGWAIRSDQVVSCAAFDTGRLLCWTWCCFWDLRSAAGMRGIQECLSFISVAMTAPGLYPEHDLFIQ